MDFGNGRWIGHWTGNVPTSTTNPLLTELFCPSNICARGIYIVRRKLRIALSKVLYSQKALPQNTEEKSRRKELTSTEELTLN